MRITNFSRKKNPDIFHIVDKKNRCDKGYYRSNAFILD